jgi:recombination protein RecA
MVMIMEKAEKIRNLIKKINKDSTEPVIQMASDIVDKFGFYSTPFPALNNMIKGIPIGRFSIIAGRSQTGKTALCYQIIAHLQEEDPEFIGAWVDFENSHDPVWAEKLGVDLERLVILSYTDQAANMEAVMDKLIQLLRLRCVGIVIIDSIGGMIPKGDVEDKQGDRSLEKANMLNLQTKIGEVFRKFNPFRGTAIIMIGHIYQSPNAQGYVIEEVRGGNAVKHWAHIRLVMKRGPKATWPKEIEVIGLDGKERKVYPGFSGRIIFEKSKNNANEGQEIAVDFYHGRGFDRIQSTIAAAEAAEILQRKGGWYYCDLLPDGKTQGKEAVTKFFVEDSEAYGKLAGLVDEHSAGDIG